MNTGFSWSEFFAMGGYATYVWWSYGICFVVLLLNVVMPLQHRKRVLRRVRRAIRRESLQTGQPSGLKTGETTE